MLPMSLSQWIKEPEVGRNCERGRLGRNHWQRLQPYNNSKFSLMM